MIETERQFGTAAALAEALAADVAAFLSICIEENASATVAVSGGSTPKLFFERLSQAGIAWASVTVTLVDERQVAETSLRSNARLVRDHLLRGLAAAARFVPLDDPHATRLRLDAVVLGMGNDGHTASFFPGAGRLAAALDLRGPERILAIMAPGVPEPRLTFTLSALLEAKFLCLHIEGHEKRRTLTKALEFGPEAEMPIRAVLNSATPLTLYWCP